MRIICDFSFPSTILILYASLCILYYVYNKKISVKLNSTWFNKNCIYIQVHIYTLVYKCTHKTIQFEDVSLPITPLLLYLRHSCATYATPALITPVVCQLRHSCATYATPRRVSGITGYLVYQLRHYTPVAYTPLLR